MQPVRTSAQALRKQVPGELRKVPVVVTEDAAQRVGGEPEYDAVVLGGTLGLLVAARLQLAGHSVAVVERQRAVGRTQEWNSSREELSVRVSSLLLSDAFQVVVRSRGSSDAALKISQQNTGFAAEWLEACTLKFQSSVLTRCAAHAAHDT